MWRGGEMSNVLYDEWDRAYEEGKKIGREQTIRDCIAAVDADNLHNEDPSWDGTNWNNAVYACKEALLALLEEK
jgi:hypothetical protein